MKPFFWFSARTVGGADGSAGEDAAGAGHHQAASVLHPAVAAREGPTPEQPSSGQTEAAPGDSGDEVSPNFQSWMAFNPIPLWDHSFSLKPGWVKRQEQARAILFCDRVQPFFIWGLLQLLPWNCFSVMASRVWSTSAIGCVLTACVSFICTKTLAKHQTGRKQWTWLLLALTAVELVFE